MADENQPTDQQTIAKKRRRALLPPRGQPGSRDDPFRRGLSGAGVRWYLYYLRDGFTPIDAQLSAITHSSYRAQNTVAPMRNRYNIYIMPKFYPRNFLRKYELRKLTNAICLVIKDEVNIKLKFGMVYFKPGALMVECKNSSSKTWLEERLDLFSALLGIRFPLTSCLEYEMQKHYTVSIELCHLSLDDRFEAFFIFDEFNTSVSSILWGIISLHETRSGLTINAIIDHKSMQSVKKNNNTLNYQFGAGRVRLIKNMREPLLPKQ